MTLLARNPRLIYGHITGFGREGPDADKAAFDIAAFWSRAGIAYLLTPPGGRLPFQRGGMGDHNTGSTFAGGICAALYSREKTGRGPARLVVAVPPGRLHGQLRPQHRRSAGAATRRSACARRCRSPSVNNYAAGCGRHFWIVGLDGDRHWPPLVRLVGHPEWLDDPRFATPLDRAMNAGADRRCSTRPSPRRRSTSGRRCSTPSRTCSGRGCRTPFEVVNDPRCAPPAASSTCPTASATMPMIATPVDFHGTPWSPAAWPRSWASTPPRSSRSSAEERPARASRAGPSGTPCSVTPDAQDSGSDTGLASRGPPRRRCPSSSGRSRAWRRRS